jgi:dTDP-4-amino-4,6-dideoxy-D-galactose acyltransferase
MNTASAGRAVRPMHLDRNPRLDGDLRKLVELVEQWPHRPYSYLPGTSSRSQSTYVVKTLQKAQEEGAVSYIARQGEECAAISQYETLAWDSEVIGLPIGRISWLIDRAGTEDSPNIRGELLRLTIEEAQRSGTRYLLARVSARDVAAIHRLEKCGFELLDGILTFGTSAITKIGPSENQSGLHCRPFLPEDLPALQEIAASSFSADRFHSDPLIPKAKADELHRRWIENSCAGFADCVLIAEESEPIGFTTLKIDRSCEANLGIRVGVVVLVATSVKHRHRGIASLLTQFALSWFSQAGCHWVEVGTQLANVQASRVYQWAGFKLVSSSLTFRKLL